MKFPQFRALRNAGVFLALGGGLLALCAFFFLPYFSVETLHQSYPYEGYPIGVQEATLTGAQLASKDYPSLADLARLYPREGVTSGFTTVEQTYREEPSPLWLEPLVAVIAIVLAAVLLLFRRQPVLTTGPWLCIWLLVGIALLTLISLLGRYHSDVSIFGWNLVSYSWGFWMVLLGMVLVAVGASTVRLSWAGEPRTGKENEQEAASGTQSASDKP